MKGQHVSVKPRGWSPEESHQPATKSQKKPDCEHGLRKVEGGEDGKKVV